MIIAGTGRRAEGCISEYDVRQKVRTKLRYASGVTGVVTGMANGFDLWFADEARMLGLEIIAARPWAGHSPRKRDAELYQRIIDAAVRVVDVDESVDFPGNYCYQKRNEWMVDNADAVLAYWEGTEDGGTWNCIKYARGRKPVANVYFDPPF